MSHDCIRQRLSGQARFFEWSLPREATPERDDRRARADWSFDEMRSVAGRGHSRMWPRLCVRAVCLSRRLPPARSCPVLEKFSPPSEAFHLYYPARTMMPGKLRAFLDFMRETNRH